MKKIETNELSEETKHSMLARILTGIGIALVGIPCIVLGSWYFFGLVLILTILSAIELTHITDLKGTFKVVISVITVIMTVAIVYYIFYEKQLQGADPEKFLEQKDFLSNNFHNIHISVMLLVLTAAIYFLFSFFSKDFSVKYVFYFVTMIIVISVGIQSFLYLRYSPAYFFSEVDAVAQYGEIINTDEFKYGQSMFLFLYVLIGVIMNDIGAYFIGVLFGKHKMNEKISPKKTWEGFLGGVVFSLIFSTLFAIIVTYLGKPMLPIFDFKSGKYPLAVFFIIFISVLLPVIADVGDFIFSAIKRYWGVKDFSKILPGHGGILDRLDSLIFSSALVVCLITFINLIVLPWFSSTL